MFLHVHITGITSRPRVAKLVQCKGELVQELVCEHFWQQIIPTLMPIHLAGVNSNLSQYSDT
jgi:hypothetical protein